MKKIKELIARHRKATLIRLSTRTKKALLYAGLVNLLKQRQSLEVEVIDRLNEYMQCVSDSEKLDMPLQIHSVVWGDQIVSSVPIEFFKSKLDDMILASTAEAILPSVPARLQYGSQKDMLSDIYRFLACANNLINGRTARVSY